jgi:acyl-CoA hydrolase
MEAEVHVEAENPITGERTFTNNAYLVYVALGDDGKPVEVPPLVAENESQRLRMEDGRARQAYRLAQSRKAQSANQESR